MTREEYLTYHKDMCDRMVETTKRKNADYTGNSDDPFFNFRLVEMYGALSTEQGFFTRLSDKFSRIASFVKRGVLLVKDETIEDTLIDMANYCILFAGYIKSKKLKESQTQKVLDGWMGDGYYESCKLRPLPVDPAVRAELNAQLPQEKEEG